jgi:hypothetical protein
VAGWSRPRPIELTIFAIAVELVQAAERLVRVGVLPECDGDDILAGDCVVQHGSSLLDGYVVRGSPLKSEVYLRL